MESGQDFEVDITPSVTTYELYQIASYTHWFSIGEFVDNSITSAMQNWDALTAIHGSGYSLDISIDLDRATSTLTISDNAGGIFKADIERALRAGEAPTDKRWLSVHGVGMKMSSFWWGRRLNIVTTPIGDNASYEVSVDLDEIKESKSAKIVVHELPREELPGTFITISKISNEKWPKGTGLGKLKSLLTSMYRVYINDSDKPVRIFFNGSKLEFKRLPMLEAPYWANTEGPVDNQLIRWERDFQFTTSQGRTIRGHVGLLSKMSRDLSGFFLHYKGKGMGGIGYSDADDAEFSIRDLKDSREYYRPQRIFGQEGSYRYQRFTGEFDISELGKTASTDSIKWDSDEEQEFLDALEVFLKDKDFNMWGMAQNFQQRKAARIDGSSSKDDETDLSQTEVESVIKQFVEGWKEEQVGHSENDDHNHEPISLSLIDTDESDFFDSEVFVLRDSSQHEHSFRFSYLENPDYEMFTLLPGEANDHSIRLNTGHPVIRKLQWGNPAVREAILNMLILMAVPEVFLPLRCSSSSFRNKINEIADAPRTGRPRERATDA